MQWENHWLRHIRLGETVLTVKDEYWKDGRERRYVLFLYNDYDYFETVVEDGFLKEKTSLFLLPDFILGNNPVKTTVQFQLEVKQRITMPREYLRCHNCLIQDYDSVYVGINLPDIVMRSIITMRLRQTLKPVSLSSLRVVCDYIPK